MELLTDEEILKKGYNALEQIGGTVKFAFNKFQQIQQLIRSATPQPINQALDALSGGVEYVAGKTPIGVADRGASALGEMVGQATGNELLGQVVGFGAGIAVPGPEISRAAKPVIPKGIKPEVITQPPTPPPMDFSPAMALASSGGGMTLQKAAPTLAELSAQPLQIASDIRPTGWQGSIKTLLKENAPVEQVKKVLEQPYHKDIKAKYKAMSLEEFAKDKGGWLTRLIGRADELKGQMSDYMRSKSASKQRRMYDDFTQNPLNPSEQLYDPANPIRKMVTKTFNTVVGKEWHHIFGNKEAAEFMLTTVAQDPYVAMNLMHLLQKIKLPTSGVPENIVLMNKALHRKKGGYHSWAKEIGLEGAGKKKGELAIADWGSEISNAILSGNTDVNELFSIIETYARLVNTVVKPKLKKEFGAEIISEMGPVMQAIQGVKK
jgi:hypothetical protein